MEILRSTLLLIGAFCLGACPFSLWLGWWILGKDIRDFGDHNPGTANVFRAGGRISGYLAVFLDIAKGIPFIFLANSVYKLPESIVFAVAMSAILGHAWSPLLKFKGGKAVAVTFGVLLALPQHEMFIVFTLFTVLGFLFVESDAWTVMLGPAGTLAYLLITKGTFWELIFMLGVLALFAVKQNAALRSVPRFKIKLIVWYQSRRQRI